jgi:hypothetical protein
MKLSFLPGRAAQASNIDTLPDCVTHRDICSFVDVPTLALDDVLTEHPALAPVHILKIYAYGEELNGLLGSRKLLNDGSICLIYMHGNNLKKGFGNNILYAEQLWDVLQDYDMLHYPTYNSRSPQFTVMTSSADFQNLFTTDREVVDDFVIALSNAAQCQEFRNCVDLN